MVVRSFYQKSNFDLSRLSWHVNSFKKSLFISIFVSALFMQFGLVAKASFLPESDLLNAAPQALSNDMTEVEFNQILDQIKTAYSPTVTQFGGKLSIQGEWKSNKLNAGANQLFGSWNVKISGALARRAELTNDGFTLIVCHELGHHLAGFPLAGSPIPDLPIPIPKPEVWAAVEGQADYFSTQVCARKLWANDLEINRRFRDNVNRTAQKRCDEQWNSDDERNLCYRVSTAAESIGATMAGIKNEALPHIETPDLNVVSKTSEAHPATQCRLDTLVAGAFCPVAFNPNLIPGKKVNQGPASEEAEKEAALVSCTNLSGHTEGLRPACWFKSRM